MYRHTVSQGEVKTMNMLRAASQTTLEAKPAPTYTAMFRKDPEDPRYWLAQLEEEPRVHTFGRSLAEANLHIQDATRLWYQLPADQPIRLRRRVARKPVDRALSETESLREKVAELQLMLADRLRDVAVQLTNDLNLSTREAGTVLDISHQRIQQLLDSRRGTSARKRVPAAAKQSTAKSAIGRAVADRAERTTKRQTSSRRRSSRP
jgi:predicted RNase H-like HicB family nuclease